jgi:hypothetical protein
MLLALYLAAREVLCYMLISSVFRVLSICTLRVLKIIALLIILRLITTTLYPIFFYPFALHLVQHVQQRYRFSIELLTQAT